MKQPAAGATQGATSDGSGVQGVRSAPEAGAVAVSREAPRPAERSHVRLDVTRAASRREEMSGRAAYDRHMAQVDAERASPPLVAAPKETRSRFSGRTWEEADLVNGALLPASEPPMPEHLRAELAGCVPKELRDEGDLAATRRAGERGKATGGGRAS